MTSPNDALAPCEMHSLTPRLVCAGASDAIDFYKAAFGAVELSRQPGANGAPMHAMLRIGDSALMLVDECPEWEMLGPKTLKGTPVTVHLCVDNVDAVVARAVAAGATITMPIADLFGGDRYGKLVDPFGHQWSVATQIHDMTTEKMRQAVAQMMGH